MVHSKINAHGTNELSSIYLTTFTFDGLETYLAPVAVEYDGGGVYFGGESSLPLELGRRERGETVGPDPVCV